ncbi:MAG: alpha-mannosidase [Acetanaerobacterium sp.]
MENKYTLYTVTKTHWDREWYMNYQKTRIKLVHLIDDLLDILDNDPEFVSFMMDGQTLPLDDYLEVKPYNRARLEKYIQNGRIIIGPWYILPDEILITGESHIRNYLMGSRIAKEFGADKMQIGYLPDSFGHPSQMPQILSKLGMDTIMFWRGATAEIDKTEFYWEAPDGTRVLTILMPDGYSTGAELPNDPAAVAKRIDAYIEKFAHLASTDLIYLSNGGDHLEPVPYLSNVIKEANKLMKKGTMVHTTLPHFVSEIKKVLPKDLKAVTGELCGVNKSILLASTLSTRTYLKQENHQVSHLLENYLEPIFSISALQGNAYPRDILVTAWKYLLTNLPHDSICGCSVDDVHRDMLYRYNQVKEIGGELYDLLGKFYRGVDTTSIGGNYAATIVNTTCNTRTDVVEAVVDFDETLLSALDFSEVTDDGISLNVFGEELMAKRRLPTAVKVFDGEEELPCILLDAFASNKLDLDYFRFPHQFNVNRCKIQFIARDVPAMGYKTFKLVPLYEDADNADDFDPNNIELCNEFYSVTPCFENGSVTVTDVETGKRLEGLNMLADTGDCGDEYTYCPPEEDFAVYTDPSSVRARMLEHNALRQSFEITGTLMLPATIIGLNKGRTKETVPCTYKTVVTLYKGIKRVDVKTTVDNKAKYHRLRVLFPAGVLSEYSYSSGIFSVDRRPVNPPLDPNWQELFYTHPQKDFCEVNDGTTGLTIANRGLHEYEVYNEGGQSIIAVTLLRCVEQISRQYIKTRKAPGGWNEKAPDAQCIGSWDFEYSILPHRKDWQTSETYVGAHEYNVPMKAIQVPAATEGGLPPSCSMVQYENKEFILSAFKKCEDGEDYVLRFFNSTDKHVSGKITFGFDFASVALANLREDVVAKLAVQDKSIQIAAKPFEIITLKITL